MKGWRKQVLEGILLAILAFGPLFLAARPVKATDSTCSGTTIGMWCNLRYDDPTICQDCAQLNCDFGCIGHTSQEYYYCVTVAFLWCLT